MHTSRRYSQQLRNLTALLNQLCKHFDHVNTTSLHTLSTNTFVQYVRYFVCSPARPRLNVCYYFMARYYIIGSAQPRLRHTIGCCVCLYFLYFFLYYFCQLAAVFLSRLILRRHSIRRHFGELALLQRKLSERRHKWNKACERDQINLDAFIILTTALWQQHLETSIYYNASEVSSLADPQLHIALLYKYIYHTVIRKFNFKSYKTVK